MRVDRSLLPLLLAPCLVACPRLDLSSEGMNHHDKVTGQKHGTWTTYYSSGQRSSQGTYDQGKQVGVWQHWDEQGQLTRTEHYAPDGTLERTETP